MRPGLNKYFAALSLLLLFFSFSHTAPQQGTGQDEVEKLKKQVETLKREQLKIKRVLAAQNRAPRKIRRRANRSMWQLPSRADLTPTDVGRIFRLSVRLLRKTRP